MHTQRVVEVTTLLLQRELLPLLFELELIGKSLLTSSIQTHKHELQSVCSAIKLHLLAQATLYSDKLNLMP